MNDQPKPTIDSLLVLGAARLPGHLGIMVQALGPDGATLSMPVTPVLLNLFGSVHGGALVSLADTACGYATLANLPADATSFTTIELKTNFLGAARDGTLTCMATPVHLGRTTQVWDAVVTHVETARRVALFRCTNLVIR